MSAADLPPPLRDLLAGAHAGEPVLLAGPAATCVLDDPRALLGADAPHVVAALAELDPESASEVVRGELARWLDEPGAEVALAGGGAAALDHAGETARARTRRGRVLVLEGVADEDLAALRVALGPDVAAVVLEPWRDDDAVRELVDAARAHGAWIVVDETRSAGRLGAACSPLAREADLVCVGEGLAGGLAFGAVVARAPVDPPGPPAAAAVALAAATLLALRDAPAHAALAAHGERLREVFAAACAREGLEAELAGPAAAPVVVFRGQENADPGLLRHHFGLELEAAGVRGAERLLLHAGVLGSGFGRVAAAFDHACARLRTLLVEYNSYLCGGMGYPFAGGDPELRARGFAVYRYPAPADVEVRRLRDRVRITFAAEDSPLTSSGMYLPVRVRGDFDVSVGYAIRRWRPGPDCACLALFVQNEPSTARYYAQRMSSGAAPDDHDALAVLCAVEHGRRRVAGERGAFRLTREGATLRAWHRGAGDGAWSLLGEDAAASTDDVIVGAKVWSLVRCEGVEVDLTDLRVAGTIPADQIPRLGPRPDPRLARLAGVAATPAWEFFATGADGWDAEGGALRAIEGGGVQVDGGSLRSPRLDRPAAWIAGGEVVAEGPAGTTLRATWLGGGGESEAAAAALTGAQQVVALAPPAGVGERVEALRLAFAGPGPVAIARLALEPAAG